ncbi:MAG TPA: translation initiation factor IF-3 [Methylomirabilota bacterium]|nr:translation initiation factor IF-3 [Methylomirabilota bacterium]
MAKEAGVRINQQIRAREVRVIDADGTQVGIMPLGEALRLAESKELDLVEVSPTATPPVCRIMDYGKFRYLQKKKVQESRKHQTQVLVKEVKLGSRTSEHDIDFKVNHIRRFLEKKQRVKVSVLFRGREITHPEIGKEMLDKVVEKVQDIGSPEGQARLEGRNMSILMVPR